MKTKQALFLAGVNVVFAIAAIRWFEASWEQLGHVIHHMQEVGHQGGSRSAGVWSITMFGQQSGFAQQSEVAAHFIPIPNYTFDIIQLR